MSENCTQNNAYFTLNPVVVGWITARKLPHFEDNQIAIWRKGDNGWRPPGHGNLSDTKLLQLRQQELKVRTPVTRLTKTNYSSKPGSNYSGSKEAVVTLTLLCTRGTAALTWTEK